MGARAGRQKSGIGRLLCGLAAIASLAGAQTPDLQAVLERLDRLEAQNQELMKEIRALREQLASGATTGATTAAAPGAAAQPPSPSTVQGPDQPAAQGATGTPGGETAATVAENVAVQQHQIAQLDQEKVSTDHRLPLSLTGMVLFNGYWTGSGAGGAANPTIAAEPSTPGQAAGGGTFRQTVLGLKYDGPEIAGGGKITGSVYMDFFGGTGATLNQLLRLRVASIDAAWKYTTVTVALDKPIIAPREPDSLAQVGVSPLTSAGNLWLWQPQVRVEQRFAFGSQAGLRAQLGVYETSESGTGISSEYSSTLESSRPGYEGRFELWAQSGESRRIEIAPGFHISDTHVLGRSVPSQIFTLDWLIRPISRVDITGAFFQGENVGVVGGLRQGVAIEGYGPPRAVPATGGWAQVTLRATPRLSFHIYGGQESDRPSYLQSGEIARNLAYAGNVMYRFGSNVLGSFEASQVRTRFVDLGLRTFPHYDLGLAYLF
ncbi:MAG TPA: hypothetical protein VIY49_02035 [Bryobacteraceae bacterium]